MIYYLVQAIDVIDYSKLEILKQCRTEEEAIKSVKEMALKLIKENGGKRQVDIATEKINDNINSIATGKLKKYPLGYYIKEKDRIVEIYEKYENTGYIYSTYKMHLIKVVTITQMEIKDDMNLVCGRGSLFRSVYNPENKLNELDIKPVPYMNELRIKLELRNEMKAKKDANFDEQSYKVRKCSYGLSKSATCFL